MPKAPAAPKAKTNSGTERDHDVPWNEKKVKLFKVLKQLKAFGLSSAAPGSAVVEKCDLSPRDVRHYSYHAKAAGLIEVAKQDGKAGYVYYLTSKGQKIDPDKELKKQELEKSKE